MSTASFEYGPALRYWLGDNDHKLCNLYLSIEDTEFKSVSDNVNIEIYVYDKIPDTNDIIPSGMEAYLIVDYIIPANELLAALDMLTETRNLKEYVSEHFCVSNYLDNELSLYHPKHGFSHYIEIGNGLLQNLEDFCLKNINYFLSKNRKEV